MRLRNDAVDQTVVNSLLRCEEEVSVGVSLDLFERLARVQGDELVQHSPDPDDLAGVDVEVAGLTLEALAADERLVHVDCRAWKSEPLALGPGHEDDRAEAGRPPDAHCRDGRPHVLHGVVDGQAGGHSTAWGVDVDLDLFLRIVRRQVHQLSDHEVGDDVVDGPADDDDPVPQQPRVDVKSPLAVAAFVLDDCRDVSHSGRQLTTKRGGGRPPQPASST